MEWIPDDENPGEFSPILLRRNDKQILAEYNELRDEVWWNRHQVWLQKIESGEEPLREGQREILERAKKAAGRIEGNTIALRKVCPFLSSTPEVRVRRRDHERL